MKKGWEIKSLGDICEFRNGLWTGKKPPFQNVGVIRNTNFTKDGKLDDSDIVYLDVEQSQFTNRKLQFGDIILEKSGGGPKQPVGRVIIFNKKKGDFSFSNFTSVIRITNAKTLDFTYLHKFLFFSYISGATEAMQSHSTGIRNLKFDDYKAIKVPIPPLTEQQSIVAILDEAFAAIAKAKANAEQNLKNSKELFESYLQEVLENGDWEEKTLGQLSKNKDAVVSGPFGSNLKVSDYKTEGIPILRLQNIGKGYFINKSIKYITEQKAEELKYHSFVAGDIALAKLGIPIGKTCIIPENFKSGIITADIVRIRPDLNVVNYKFLENFLNTSLSVSQLTGNISGATRPRVNLSDVRNIIIKLPSLKEQENIVKKLDSLSAETKRLEAIYQTKINDLEELKKSLLQKAFSGELKTAKVLV